MTAKRTEIRRAVADLIRPLFTKAFPYRASAIDPDHFPCAFVYIETGRKDPDHDGHQEVESVLTIEFFVRGMGDLESDLDQLEVQINNLVEANPTIGGVIDGIAPVDFAYDRIPEAASTSLALTYKISYDEE